MLSDCEDVSCPIYSDGKPYMDGGKLFRSNAGHVSIFIIYGGDCEDVLVQVPWCTLFLLHSLTLTKRAFAYTPEDLVRGV